MAFYINIQLFKINTIFHSNCTLATSNTKNQNVNYLTTILNNTNSYLSDIANSVKVLSSDPWVMIGAITSIILAIIAVYAANKDVFNNWFFKPKIRIDKHAFTLKQDQGTLIISRLTIRNLKKQIAKNVTLWVEKLQYYENNTWKIASNVLQFPLRWTHDTENEHKDLLYARPYPLDLCEIKCSLIEGKLNPIEIHLCTLYKGPKAHGLDDLKIGKSKLLITLYCENHPIKYYSVTIEWDGTINYPEIKIREEIRNEALI